MDVLVCTVTDDFSHKTYNVLPIEIRGVVVRNAAIYSTGSKFDSLLSD
jgi:hypothetical protein